MSDTRELLAMMTPHGVQVGKPFGGIPKLTGLDVAGAMGMGLDRLEAHLLLVKYADERALMTQIRIAWFMVVMDHGRRAGWKSEQQGRFKNLADTTMAEFLGLNLCSNCRGRGQTMLRKLPLTCSVCEGSGKQHPSERAMARGVGITVQSYRKSWTDRVRWCRDELERRERVAVALLSAALRG